MTEDNGWKRWAAQAALTIILTALAAFGAAFGGIRAGLSAAEQRLARVETQQLATDRDMARVEKKIDRVDEKVDGLLSRTRK